VKDGMSRSSDLLFLVKMKEKCWFTYISTFNVTNLVSFLKINCMSGMLQWFLLKNTGISFLMQNSHSLIVVHKQKNFQLQKNIVFKYNSRNLRLRLIKWASELAKQKE
jgi:hypothetical protein